MHFTPFTHLCRHPGAPSRPTPFHSLPVSVPTCTCNLKMSTSSSALHNSKGNPTPHPSPALLRERQGRLSCILHQVLQICVHSCFPGARHHPLRLLTQSGTQASLHLCAAGPVRRTVHIRRYTAGNVRYGGCCSRQYPAFYELAMGSWRGVTRCR